MELNSTEDLPGYLVEVLPEAAEAVEEVRLEYRDEPGVGVYGYVSLAFWWPVFEPALEDGSDPGLICRCFEVLEAMLSCPEQEVRDAAAIRVTPYLFTSRWWSWVCRYAGPATRADLRRNDCEPVVPRLAEYAGYVRERFPEYRTAIDEAVAGRPVDWYVAHELTRDVLAGTVLREAIESGDDQMLWRWYRSMEEVLASPDDELRDAVLQVIPRAASGPTAHAEASQMRAGRLLATAIDEHYGDATWRSKTDWVEEQGEVLRVTSIVCIYQYRGELLLHGRRHSQAEDNWPTTRPFARMPAASSPDEIGAVVSKAFAELAQDTSEAKHLLDEFLEFAGGMEWRTLYTNSLIVALERMHADGSIHVWPHAGEQRGDLFVSGQLTPTTAYLESPADLGASVLAALHRSSTTGLGGG